LGIATVAQIFVSHSNKDRELVDVFARAFASTKVRAVYEEFESILHGPATAQRITGHIAQANAVFIVLGRNVEQLKHTRDWVAFESGVAAGSALQSNKDVWVFEAIADTDSLSVVIPRLRHYVCFDHKDERSQAYLTQIINSYDDSHVLTAMAAGGLAGAWAAAGAADRAAGSAAETTPLCSPDSVPRRRRLRGDGQGSADPGAAAVPGCGQPHRDRLGAAGGVRLDAVPGAVALLTGARREARHGQSRRHDVPDQVSGLGAVR